MKLDPDGLALDDPPVAAAGKIYGTPTTAGTFIFTVQVTDGAGGSAFKTFSLTVNPNLGALTITNSFMPTGTVNTLYVLNVNPLATLVPGGGDGTYSWSVASGHLPTSMSLDPTTGQIIGTPSAAGTFAFTAEVDSGGLSAFKTFSLTIYP